MAQPIEPNAAEKDSGTEQVSFRLESDILASIEEIRVADRRRTKTDTIRALLLEAIDARKSAAK